MFRDLLERDSNSDALEVLEKTIENLKIVKFDKKVMNNAVAEAIKTLENAVYFAKKGK